MKEIVVIFTLGVGLGMESRRRACWQLRSAAANAASLDRLFYLQAYSVRNHSAV